LSDEEQKSSFGWVGWFIAFVAITAAGYFGYRSTILRHELDASNTQVAQFSTQAARAQQLADALSSPDAKQVTLTETRQPVQPAGHAAYLSKTGALIFVASNLRPVPQSKTYELWLIPAGAKPPIAAGLFRPDASGNASVVQPPLSAGVDAKRFLVTVEDAGGASTPTLPIVMSGQ
jgi:hypothetical protein